MQSKFIPKISITKASLVTGALAFVLLMLSLSSQPTLVYITSSFLSPILAILCAAFTIVVWQSLLSHEQASKVLLGFALVFSLWALAEVLWMIFLLLGIEPYPSLADLFWVVGYAPLIYALVLNTQFLKVKLSQWQNQVIFGVLLVGFLLTFVLVFIPIMIDFSADRILEGLINLAYPTLDLILLFYTLRLFFIAYKSNFRAAWLIIALGLSLTIAADLAYSVATWHELYSAEHENLLSKVIDWGYLAGYPVFTLGIYAIWSGHQHTQVRQVEPAPATTPLPILTNTTFLIYTDRDHEVIGFSDNLSLLQRNLTKKTLGDFMADLSGTDLEESRRMCQVIWQEIRSEEMIKDFRVPIRKNSGETGDAWLSGVNILNPLNEFVGMNMILRTYIPGAVPNQGLSAGNLGVAQFITNRCGLQEYPIKDLCISYVERNLHGFYQLLMEEMGEVVADRMLEGLSRLSKEEDWGLAFDGEKITETRSQDLKQLTSHLSKMLRNGKEYTLKMVGAESVTAEISNAEKTLDKHGPILIKDYGLSLL